jgi:hypothetical protein
MANVSKWAGLKAISVFLASVLIPVVIFLGGNSFSKAIKDKEIKLRYIEIAVQILQQEPNENNKDIRNWAIKVISKYSEVPINEETAKELMKLRIPIGTIEKLAKKMAIG